ncbi:MAG: flavin prenyltransferase UbiX [Nitrospirota bacterium]
MSDYIVGITGASGSIYGVRLVQELAQRKHNVHVVVTSAGKQVMKEEIGVSDKKEMLRLLTKEVISKTSLLSFPQAKRVGNPSQKKDSGQAGMTNKEGMVRIWENDDFTAPFMSGSNAQDAVIVIPCSMGKLAAIANGISSNLLERIADVALKEKGQLILVVREAPLSLIHLENMVKVARAGAQILPAMPAFYHNPKTIDDMVNFIVGKVLNLLRIEHKLFKGWRKE